MSVDENDNQHHYHDLMVDMFVHNIVALLHRLDSHRFEFFLLLHILASVIDKLLFFKLVLYMPNVENKFDDQERDVGDEKLLTILRLVFENH